MKSYAQKVRGRVGILERVVVTQPLLLALREHKLLCKEQVTDTQQIQILRSSIKGIKIINCSQNPTLSKA